MWLANPTWGSPRIVLELKKLGIEVAKSTVERYRPKAARPTGPGRKAFLKLHAQDMVSMDFFVVPTAGLKVLFVLVILGHDRRRALHFNVTRARQPNGRLSSSLKPFRSKLRRDSCSETATRSSVTK